MFLVHLFVCFARVCFCPFSFLLVSRVGCGLKLRHNLDLSINVLATMREIENRTTDTERKRK